MIVFCDRVLGRKIIPDALRAIGVQVEVHDAHFPQERLYIVHSRVPVR